MAATSAASLPVSSALRRAARTSGEAVRKILTSAAGSTVVPMSRPSATIPPGASAAIVRCNSVIRVRTSGTALTALTAAVTSEVRIAAETSAPSTVIVGACGSVPETIRGLSEAAATAAGSFTSTPLASIHHVMARYWAPVSRKPSDRRAATALEVLDFPVPEGPSMATMTEDSATAVRTFLRRVPYASCSARERHGGPAPPGKGRRPLHEGPSREEAYRHPGGGPTGGSTSPARAAPRSGRARTPARPSAGRDRPAARWRARCARPRC